MNEINAEKNNGQELSQASFKSYTVAVPNKQRIYKGIAIWGVCIAFLFAGIFIDNVHTALYLQGIIVLVLAFAFLPMLFGKYLTLNETVELYNDRVIMDDEEIPFSEIADYRIQGATIDITLKSWRKISLACGGLSDNSAMKSFLMAFDSRMKGLIYTDQIEAERKKSIFESNWWLLFLIPATCLLTGMYIYAYIKGMSIPFYRLLQAWGPLIGIWAIFLSYKKKNKGSV